LGLGKHPIVLGYKHFIYGLVANRYFHKEIYSYESRKKCKSSFKSWKSGKFGGKI
jgi:hypothetical protein